MRRFEAKYLQVLRVQNDVFEAKFSHFSPSKKDLLLCVDLCVKHFEHKAQAPTRNPDARFPSARHTTARKGAYSVFLAGNAGQVAATTRASD